jgi:hypothetical protein
MVFFQLFLVLLLYFRRTYSIAFFSFSVEVKGVTACMMCGDRHDTFKYCTTCLTQHCCGCDLAWHNHPDRKNHNRCDIEARKQSSRESAPHISIMNSESQQGQTQFVMVAHGPQPSSSQISVQDLIRRNDNASASAKGAFIRDGGEGQHKPPTFDSDPRVIGPAQAKAYFEGIMARQNAGVKDYENAQYLTRQLKEQLRIAPSDASDNRVILPVAEEKTVVVIPKKEG